MQKEQKLKFLSIALSLFGAIFIVGVKPSSMKLNMPISRATLAILHIFAKPYLTF